jgi:hypothetical protein
MKIEWDSVRIYNRPASKISHPGHRISQTLDAGDQRRQQYTVGSPRCEEL